jgi:hypothetical protein
MDVSSQTTKDKLRALPPIMLAYSSYQLAMRTAIEVVLSLRETVALMKRVEELSPELAGLLVDTIDELQQALEILDGPEANQIARIESARAASFLEQHRETIQKGYELASEAYQEDQLATQLSAFPENEFFR